MSENSWSELRGQWARVTELKLPPVRVISRSERLPETSRQPVDGDVPMETARQTAVPPPIAIPENVDGTITRSILVDEEVENDFSGGQTERQHDVPEPIRAGKGLRSPSKIIHEDEHFLEPDVLDATPIQSDSGVSTAKEVSETATPVVEPADTFIASTPLDETQVAKIEQVEVPKAESANMVTRPVPKLDLLKLSTVAEKSKDEIQPTTRQVAEVPSVIYRVAVQPLTIPSVSDRVAVQPITREVAGVPSISKRADVETKIGQEAEAPPAPNKGRQVDEVPSIPNKGRVKAKTSQADEAPAVPIRTEPEAAAPSVPNRSDVEATARQAIGASAIEPVVVPADVQANTRQAPQVEAPVVQSSTGQAVETAEVKAIEVGFEATNDIPRLPIVPETSLAEPRPGQSESHTEIESKPTGADEVPPTARVLSKEGEIPIGGSVEVQERSEINLPWLEIPPVEGLAEPVPDPTARQPVSEGFLFRAEVKNNFKKKISEKLGDHLIGLQRAIQTRQHREQLLEPRFNVQVIGGTFLMRLEAAGSAQECLVGIGKGSAGTLWWEHRKKVGITNLIDIIAIDYGVNSECYKKLQKTKIPPFLNVPPWDCFSIHYRSGQVEHFFADRKRSAEVKHSPLSGKRRLVSVYVAPSLLEEELLTPGPERLLEMDHYVELFLLGLSVLYKRHVKTHMRPGMVVSLNQLRFRRALVKLAYLKAVEQGGISKKQQVQSPEQEEGKAETNVEVRGGVQEVRKTPKSPVPNFYPIPTEDVEISETAQADFLIPESPKLVEARQNLKPWGILPDEMSVLVKKKFESIQQTLGVRRHREELLYSIVQRQVLGGTYFMRLDMDLKTYPCLVGIGGDASVTFWWDQLGAVTPIPLTQILSVDWGLESRCYKLLQRGKTGDLLNVLPWNCFTVEFSGNRVVNFFADRRGRSSVKLDKNGKRQLVTNRSTDTYKRDPIIIESAARISEVNDDVEKFLFGFAVLFRQERSQRATLRAMHYVPGLPVSLAQLKLRRAIVKMQYITKYTADDLEGVLRGEMPSN